MKNTFSPDILAANPELAAAQKNSRAQTPSGRGHGITDDAQDYTDYEWPPSAVTLRKQAEQAIGMIERHAVRAGILEAEPVARALVALDEMVAWLESN
jgi:hypothetical protein